MITLTFLKVLIKQVRREHQKSVTFVTIGFLDKGFKVHPDACSSYLDVLMMSITLNDIAVLNICSAGYQLTELTQVNLQIYCNMPI